MTFLHTATLGVAQLVVSLAMALAVFLAAWGQTEKDGLRTWGAGLVLMCCTFALMLSMGPGPWPLPGLVAANVALATAYATGLMALWGFAQVTWAWWRVALPVVLVGGLSWALAQQDVLRVLVVNAIFASQWLALIVAVVRRRRTMPGRGYRVLILGAALVVALYGLRVCALLLGLHEVTDAFAPHVLQSAAYLLGLTGMVVLTLGFVLMTKERADAEHVQQALIDGLTGVPNRKALLEQLHRTLAQAARDQRPVAVLMLDIDRFKRVNDTWGHVAGDAVLAAVAQCLKGGLRAQDFLGRYGGEEFLVVLPGTAEAGAATLAEHLRTRVERLVVPWEPEDLRVTISVGVHVQAWPDPARQQALIDAADHAMYAAKRTGRNRVVLSGSPADQGQDGAEAAAG